MGAHSSYYILGHLLFMFLSLFHQLSHCQQPYLNYTCYMQGPMANKSEGYLCNDQTEFSCESFVTFRSRAPYNNATSIARLLGSEASEIASLNNILPDDMITANKLIIVPLSCACPVNFFQHFTTYVVEVGDTYYTISNQTYQGLTTCQAIQSQNPNYVPTNISLVTEFVVRVRCACPSKNQVANEVTSLLTYGVENGDTADSIGRMFGVNRQSILEANMLSQDTDIVPATPILVPLTNETCSVNPRLFFCKCSTNGHPTNKSLEGSNCVPDNGKSFSLKSVALLGVGIGFGLLCMFLSSYKLHQWLKERRIRIRKEGFFKQNGGILLQEKLSSDGSSEKAKLFTAEELQRATDNYNQNRFLGQGGSGTVFKGMLPDGSVVAIKRSIAIGRNQIEQFVNEVVILSQINHRNIVKLLGFCLETEAPLLVYEFISNGTLYRHIRQKDPESLLSWERRFGIVCDVAGALAYMHSAASTPIFHRDIKSSNILLDDKYNAKIADFGTSRSVPNDKTHLTTAVQGTLGYMDPEYFQSSQFTDKSDVYSFGVMLVEILTGENPFSFAEDHEGKSLITTFISLTKENQLLQILDPQVAKDPGEELEDVQAIAELATRCLRLNGKKRPTMKRVSMELENLRKSQRILEMDQDLQSFRGEESYMNGSPNTTQESVEFRADSFSETESPLTGDGASFPTIAMGDAAPTTSSSSWFVPVTFSHPVVSKLENNNFLVWRRQILATVRGHRL
ncbi:Wall-associated receptor kinase-like 9 [Morus notabilis]|uniref:Wall-associated receptor kinase-like 9 n=1 Tax=Morus notabilis TaxID=981085 RepID=W9SVE2_9ROSA|nr:wall-associated receptor kinase-like 1 [Morus notabilis]EXC29894.1 Wall-associated receptor kinase-like 9 [Morus notabilis]